MSDYPNEDFLDEVVVERVVKAYFNDGPPAGREPTYAERLEIARRVLARGYLGNTVGKVLGCRRQLAQKLVDEVQGRVAA